MDRNHLYASSGVDFSVALRKESVDRNKAFSSLLIGSINRSLSARRAWIEMGINPDQSGKTESLSARRAWIEIGKSTTLTRIAWGRSPQGERG